MASLSESRHALDDGELSSPRDERAHSIKSERGPSDRTPSDHADSRKHDIEAPLDGAAQGAESESDEKPSTAPLPPEAHFPEGGLWAWAAIASGWLYLFVSFGLANAFLTSAAFGVFQDYYLGYIPDVDSAKISWLGSLQLCLQFAVGSIAGKLFDEGYYRQLTIAGSVLLVGSYLAVSACDRYWQLILCQGIGMGIGCGCLFLPAVGIVSQYFRRRRALAIGLTVTGSSIGGIIHPIMLNRLFPRIGFPQAVRASAYLVLGCCVIAQLLARSRIPGRKHRQTQPPPFDFATIVKDTPYLFAVSGAFFVALGLFYPIFYIQFFALEHGIDPSLSFYTLAILNAASVIGRTLPNWLADIYGPLRLTAISSVLSAIVAWTFVACTNTAGVVVFCVLYGSFSGAYVSLIAPALASLSRHFGEIGVRLGFGFLIVSIAGLLGAPIAGYLLGNSQTDLPWIRPNIFSGVAITIGAALFSTAWWIQSRRKGTAVV